MVSNFQINTNDPSIMYLNHLVIPKKYLFELMTKSGRKAVAGILARQKEHAHPLSAGDCFCSRLIAYFQQVFLWDYKMI